MNIILEKDFNFTNKQIKIGTATEQYLNINTFNQILEVLKVDKIKCVDEFYEKAIFALCSNNIDWINFLSDHKKKEYYDYLKFDLQQKKKYATEYFFSVFPKRLKLFRHIKEINSEYKKPAYKHSSITGRLAISSGTNFLTMKKSLRNKLKHENKNRVLYELDFKSCEPNFYARYFSLIPREVEDIYEFISKEIDIEVDRDNIKKVILSTIYGANQRSLSRVTGISIKKIKKINELLNIESFEQSLKNEYLEKGFIENAYGRPILSNNNLVNYWIQSSAVDFCCLSFLNFVNENPTIELHAVIHDAIIFSAEASDKSFLIDDLGDKNISIPVKIKRVSCDN